MARTKGSERMSGKIRRFGPSWHRLLASGFIASSRVGPTISTLLAHVDQIHRRAGIVLALSHGVLGRMTGEGYVKSCERPAACGKYPPG